MKKINFSAGPSILPQEVFRQSAEAILDFNGSGLSLLEISHRSDDFVALIEEARGLVKKLMNLNDAYEVLFLGGGASLQFLMVPYNLMKNEHGRAAYLDTGVWAAGAIKEAKFFGEVNVVASSKEDIYRSIPKDYSVGPDNDYFHCTSNNTIYGTQMKEFPKVEVPMVCDMSSDIFSVERDYSQFDLIYAGAQKNIGPAGMAVVVVKKDILGQSGRAIPSYMNYQLHIEKESMFNTPPVFAIYTTLLTLQYLEKNGGVAAAEKNNHAKAKLIYDEIDRNPNFIGYAAKEDRSLMNVTFNLTDPNSAQRFDELWKSAGISGLKGHRSAGGYRASIYNAMPLEGVQVLVEVMKNLD